MQFMVYSGYFFVLFLIYAVAGICRLSITGWMTSFRMCCHEGPSLVPPQDKARNSGGEEAEIPSLDDKPTMENGWLHNCDGKDNSTGSDSKHCDGVFKHNEVAGIDDVK